MEDPIIRYMKTSLKGGYVSYVKVEVLQLRDDDTALVRTASATSNSHPVCVSVNRLLLIEEKYEPILLPITEEYNTK